MYLVCSYNSVVVAAFNNSSYRSWTTFYQNFCKPSISKSLPNGSKEGTNGVKRGNPDNQLLKLIVILPQNLKDFCADRLIESKYNIMLPELPNHL